MFVSLYSSLSVIATARERGREEYLSSLMSNIIYPLPAAMRMESLSYDGFPVSKTWCDDTSPFIPTIKMNS